MWSLTLRLHSMVPNPEKLVFSKKKETSTQPVCIQRVSM